MHTNTPNWLIPFDGSEHSLRALSLAIQEARMRTEMPKLLLLNVQAPLPSDITRFIPSASIDDFHREAGEKILAPAKSVLENSGLQYSLHILVGTVAHSIVDFAASHGCSMTIMGTHGHGSVAGMVMGSVATKVLSQIEMPVLLSK